MKTHIYIYIYMWDIYFARDPEESFENASSCPQKSRRKLLTYKVSI